MSVEDFLLCSTIVLTSATVIGVPLTWVLLVVIAIPYFYFTSQKNRGGSISPRFSSQAPTSKGAADYLRRRSMQIEHLQ